MLPSEKIIYKSLQPYLNQGYILCPDTNFVMSAPGVFTKLQNETVVMAKQAFDELDNLKSTSSNATDDEQKRSSEAREAFRVFGPSSCPYY